MATSSACADNIVLIGFMGAGKSSVGRELARRTGRFFLDADALIETAQGEAIHAIFDERGEEYFRELERESARWMAECVRGSIISTGGGMPTVVERLRDIGTVVYLQLPFEKILRLISADERSKRPLFHNAAETKRLYAERQSIYEKQAHVTIDADRPVEAIVEEIIQKLSAS